MEETESTPPDAESKPAKTARGWAGSESAVRVADLFVGAVAITLVFWLAATPDPGDLLWRL